MVSGSELPPGQAALRLARAHGGTGSATVVGSNLVAGPIEAALANGVLAHSDETDDSHGPSQSHPGAAVVPAALAAGEALGIDGTRFLRAVTLGYDVGPRMTMAMGRVAFRNESHKSTHSIAGVFGAAAAAAYAAGLTAQQMRWVIDYAAQQSSGIAAWARDTDHIEKGFVFGECRRATSSQRRSSCSLDGTALTMCYRARTIFSSPTHLRRIRLYCSRRWVPVTR